MLKTIIKLPDGTELSSGANHQNAIQSATLTECVNSGEDLILGSTCASALEATLITPNGGLSLQAGTEVTVYKDDGTTRTKVGVFVLEKPTRPTANTMKVTGYDRVSKLDKDLSAWLAGLKGWPYKLTTFAKMVCEEGCGVPFKASDVPNGDFQVQQFTRSSVTGRQIMQWLGEICARFCRATLDGEIEFAWYTDSGKTITTGGELYYFQNGLSYEDYQTAKVDAVQLRVANTNDGALWPEAAGSVNSYIITGNAILNLQITEALRPVLANIRVAIADVTYTPCKVSIPANLDIHAGHTVQITDKNGKTVTAYVMTKTQTGQKDTLECTGNRERNTTTSANNKSAADRAAEANGYADAAAQGAAQAAVDKQTQEDIFNKLTNNGQIQGIYAKDGKWYINAELAQIINLVANVITSGRLQSVDGNAYFDLDFGEIVASGSSGCTKIQNGLISVELPSDGGEISFAPFGPDSPGILMSDSNAKVLTGLCVIDGDPILICRYLNTTSHNNIGGHKIGVKTIHFMNSQGEVQSEDVYVAY